jgi:hypothetical protein
VSVDENKNHILVMDFCTIDDCRATNTQNVPVSALNEKKFCERSKLKSLVDVQISHTINSLIFWQFNVDLLVCAARYDNISVALIILFIFIFSFSVLMLSIKFVLRRDEVV